MMTSILLTLALAHSASALDCPVEKKEWKACKQDSDCVVLLNPCIEKVAYSLASKTEVKSYFSCLAPRLDCMPRPDPNKDATGAICVKNRCELTTKK